MAAPEESSGPTGGTACAGAADAAVEGAGAGTGARAAQATSAAAVSAATGARRSEAGRETMLRFLPRPTPGRSEPARGVAGYNAAVGTPRALRAALPGRDERPRRWLALAAAAVALALGLFPVHAGPGGHAGLGGPTRVLLTDAAPPSGDATRLERTAAAVELPQCAACALRLQTLGWALASSTTPVPLVEVGLASLPVPAAALAATSCASSRGPPRA